jgi:hypothetical protein
MLPRRQTKIPMITIEPGVTFAHTLWAGIVICEKRNRPAFETKEEMYAFIEKYCPGLRLLREGRCSHCGYLHFIAKPNE